MTEAVILRKGGVLFRRYWDGEKREYLEEDVTASGTRFLFQNCRLEGGLTLRDIFLFMQRHLAVLDTVFGTWCGEIVEEGLSGRGAKSADISAGYDALDFLELYWDIYEDARTNLFGGYQFPRFQGWGDLPIDTGRPGAKAGKGPLCIEFVPIYELIDLEVRLRIPLSISAQDKDDMPLREFKESFYTLGHVLYGIYWELTFAGSPAMRDTKNAEMLARQNE